MHVGRHDREAGREGTGWIDHLVGRTRETREVGEGRKRHRVRRALDDQGCTPRARGIGHVVRDARESTLKSVVGACTSAGTIAKANAKGLVGSVTPSGALRKLISKAYAGAVTATGALTRVFTSGSDLIIGLIGTFIVPAVRLLFSRVDPDITLQNVSPSITASDVSPDVPLTAVAPVLPVENVTAPITTHEPSVDD
jgi:hypothetical protein